MVGLFHFVPIVEHVRRPAEVVVLFDYRDVFHQVHPGAKEPFVALHPLGVAHMLVEPALHEAVESLVHGFRDGWVSLERVKQKLGTLVSLKTRKKKISRWNQLSI